MKPCLKIESTQGEQRKGLREMINLGTWIVQNLQVDLTMSSLVSVSWSPNVVEMIDGYTSLWFTGHL
jgi:hypothetical protein